MKLNVGKRILMFFHWLLSLLICAGLVAYVIFPDFTLDLYQKVEARLGGSLHMKIIGGALLAIYVILAVVQACLILKRRKRSDRGFITVDSSETGRTRIAISAIEQMVRQSVHSIDGISEMKINIDSKDDSIVIAIAASIVNGSHVPTITMNMQNAIRKFVEMNCGVAVSTVSISINSVTNPSDTPRRRRLVRGKQAPVPAAAPIEPETKQVPVPEFTPPFKKVEPEPAFQPAPAPAEEPKPYFEDPEPIAPAAEEPERTFDIDTDYKPTLTLDPFGTAGGAEGSDLSGEEESSDDGDTL